MGANIGCFFPTAPSLKLLREERTDAWASINKNADFSSNAKIAHNYLALWFDHGKKPIAATYAYVLLPAKTVAATQNYALRPDVEILENSAAVQAVREKRLNLLAANFWTDEPHQVDLLECNKKAAVMMRERNGVLEVAVSDPTQNNHDGIDLEINRRAVRILSKDARVRVIAVQPRIHLQVKTDKAYGQTAEIRFAVLNTCGL